MIIRCPNWKPSDVFFCGKCSLGEVKGMPSFGHCIDNCKRCTNTRTELTEYIKTLPVSGQSVMPPKHKQLIGLLKSIFVIIKNGFRFVSLYIRYKNMRTCHRCEHIRSRLWLKCGKCGCSIKLKTLFKGLHCPIDKW